MEGAPLFSKGAFVSLAVGHTRLVHERKYQDSVRAIALQLLKRDGTWFVSRQSLGKLFNRPRRVLPHLTRLM